METEGRSLGSMVAGYVASHSRNENSAWISSPAAVYPVLATKWLPSDVLTNEPLPPSDRQAPPVPEALGFLRGDSWGCVGSQHDEVENLMVIQLRSLKYKQPPAARRGDFIC